MTTRRLSPRECQVLELICKGDSNREIGEVMLISEQTVKNYITHVMLKLGVRNRTELAIIGCKGGEVSSEETSCLATGSSCRYTDCPVWSGELGVCLLRKVIHDVAEYMAGSARPRSDK